jgi:hypothetical protein
MLRFIVTSRCMEFIGEGDCFSNSVGSLDSRSGRLKFLGFDHRKRLFYITDRIRGWEFRTFKVPNIAKWHRKAREGQTSMLRIVDSYVGGEILTAVVMMNTVFWDITACIPLKVKWRFGGTYASIFRVEDETSMKAGTKQSSALCISLWFLPQLILRPWRLKMEAICSSETSIDFQRTPRRFNPEGSTLQFLYYLPVLFLQRKLMYRRMRWEGDHDLWVGKGFEGDTVPAFTSQDCFQWRWVIAWPRYERDTFQIEML